MSFELITPSGDSLRLRSAELVATINESAVSLDAAAKQTQGSVSQLAKASVAQSKQVALASESVAAMASASSLGELFQYSIGSVSLPRQRSAMLPITLQADSGNRD